MPNWPVEDLSKELSNAREQLRLMRERHTNEAAPLVAAVERLRLKSLRKGKRVKNEILEAIKAGAYSDDPTLIALGARPRSQFGAPIIGAAPAPEWDQKAEDDAYDARLADEFGE